MKLDPAPPSRMQLESMAYALYLESKHAELRDDKEVDNWVDLALRKRVAFRKRALSLLEEPIT